MYSPAFGHFGTPSYMGGDSNYEESDYTSDAPGDGIGVEGAYKMVADAGNFQAMAPAGPGQKMATHITEMMPDWNFSQPMLFGGLALGVGAYLNGNKAIGALVGLVSAAYIIQDQTISSVEFGDLGAPGLSAINAEISRLKSKSPTRSRKVRLALLIRQRAGLIKLAKKRKSIAGKRSGMKVPWGLKAAGALTVPVVGPAAAATIAARNLNRLRAKRRMERMGKGKGSRRDMIAASIRPPRLNYTGKITKPVRGQKSVTVYFWRGKRVSRREYVKRNAGSRVSRGGGRKVPTQVQAQAMASQAAADMMDGSFQTYPTSGGEDMGIETSDDLDLDTDLDSTGGPNLMLVGGGLTLVALVGYYLYSKKGKGKSKSKGKGKGKTRSNRSRRNRSR
jgi:hypothetical protein